ARTRVGAGVPGVDDGAQQPEGGDRDDDADDGQDRAQAVTQRVTKDETNEVHDNLDSASARNPILQEPMTAIGAGTLERMRGMELAEHRQEPVCERSMPDAGADEPTDRGAAVRSVALN